MPKGHPPRVSAAIQTNTGLQEDKPGGVSLATPIRGRNTTFKQEGRRDQPYLEGRSGTTDGFAYWRRGDAERLLPAGMMRVDARRPRQVNGSSLVIDGGFLAIHDLPSAATNHHSGQAKPAGIANQARIHPGNHLVFVREFVVFHL